MKRRIFMLLVASNLFYLAEAQHFIPHSVGSRPIPFPSIQGLNEGEVPLIHFPTSNSPFSKVSNIQYEKIGTAANAFTWIIARQDQISAVPSLNTVGVIFRNNQLLHGGSNGHLRYALSRDNGQTWDISPQNGTTEIGVINNTYENNSSIRNRYPDLELWADGTNVRMGWISAITDGVSFVGKGFGTVFPDANGGFQKKDEGYDNTEAYPDNGQTLVLRKPGELWYVRASADFSVSPPVLKDSLHIYRGLFNSSTEKIEWQETQKIKVLANTNSTGSFIYGLPQIHFSPDGETGWLSLLGDLNGGQDSVILPIVSQFNPATEQFGMLQEISINAMPGVSDSILLDVDENNAPVFLGRGTLTFDYDLVVDNQGKPHMMVMILPAGSVEDGKGNPYSFNIGGTNRLYDLTLDSYNQWNLAFIAAQNTHILDLWLPDNNGTEQNVDNVDPGFVVSRDEGGTKVFFHWGDTDKDVVGFDPSDPQNISPNLKGRALDISTQKWTSVVNWTKGDGAWEGRAFIPKGSELVLEDNLCNYIVPIALPLSPDNNSVGLLEIHYLKNISYNCADFIETTEWSLPLSKSSEDVAGFSVSPNPCRNIIFLKGKLLEQKNLIIRVENLEGRTFLEKSTRELDSDASLELGSLPSGIYVVKVMSQNQFFSQKIVVE